MENLIYQHGKLYVLSKRLAPDIHYGGVTFCVDACSPTETPFATLDCSRDPEESLFLLRTGKLGGQQTELKMGTKETIWHTSDVSSFLLPPSESTHRI